MSRNHRFDRLGSGHPLLALETSCDDTCAAVLDPSGTVLSSVVASQSIHAEYAGVVPELASRAHLELIQPTIARALSDAGIGLADLGAVAATCGPGLIGCLLVGLSTAKGLSLALDVPFVGVNHIEGHLWAIRAERDVSPPFVALVASGGHTELMFVPAWGRYELLGATRDDAAGEAFDKVAKLLGLGFPGGPIIDRLARDGNPNAHRFPRAYLDLEQGGFDFSFSGLKTAVRYFVEEHGVPDDPGAREVFLRDVAASFQEAVVDVLGAKVREACRRLDTPHVLLAGGVACNSALRARARDIATDLGGEAYYASPRYCSDNAAMIGLAALPRLRRGEEDPLDLPAVANFEEIPLIHVEPDPVRS